MTLLRQYTTLLTLNYIKSHYSVTSSKPLILYLMLFYFKSFTFGIRDPAYHWIKSYLSHRMQFTSINDIYSSHQYINCGVPQDSVLGLVLFLLYTNDLPCSSNKLNFLLFADDTTIYVQGHDPLASLDTLNQELTHVSDWITCNKLSLNYLKTNYMLSHTLLSQHQSLSF